ncbi:MAG: glycosyltransferase family 9 protein [Planctomycetota bacterium]|jgi:heptosyltransferase-2
MTAVLSPPRHLLVRLPNPIGDAVLATPALRALRHALPDTRITWVGGRGALGVLEGLPHADGVMPVAGPSPKGWRKPFRVGRQWRRLRPDAVLLLPHSFSSALSARLSGANVRVGSPLRGREVFLNHTVELPMEKDALKPRSMVRMYLDLAAPFGAEDDGKGTELAVGPFDHRRAARRLDGIPYGERLLGVNPGAAFGPTKVYPADRLAEVLRRLGDDGIRPIVLCGPGEEDLAEDVAAAAGPRAIPTHEDPPDLGELKALLQRCAALLTTDAGPRHVAEALGVPTVVIMGPTDPEWTAESPAVIVRKDGLPCLGCHLRACPIEHPCMRTLDPRDVAEAVRSVFERH